MMYFDKPNAAARGVGNIGLSSEDLPRFHTTYAQDGGQIWSRAASGIAAYDSETLYWWDTCKPSKQALQIQF